MWPFFIWKIWNMLLKMLKTENRKLRFQSKVRNQECVTSTWPLLWWWSPPKFLLQPSVDSSHLSKIVSEQQIYKKKHGSLALQINFTIYSQPPLESTNSHGAGRWQIWKRLQEEKKSFSESTHVQASDIFQPSSPLWYMFLIFRYLEGIHQNRNALCSWTSILV